MNIQLRHFDVLQSTNVTAVAAAQDGACEGTVIVADRQVGGRGRMNRVWNSPEGGLWFTIILRPQIDPQYVAQITLLAGVAVAKALRELYGTDGIKIKWPNDILLDEKKVCGILSEMQLDENGTIEYAVVGIGINVALKKEDIPEELQAIATSLNLSLNRNYTCQEVLDKILKEFTGLYDEWLVNDARVILGPWRNMNCTLQKQVLVKDNDEVIYKGTVIDIDEYGSIIVQSEQGETQSFNFGEISIR